MNSIYGIEIGSDEALYTGWSDYWDIAEYAQGEIVTRYDKTYFTTEDPDSLEYKLVVL